MGRFKKAPKELFREFSSYFPLPTVDIIIHDSGSILLAKRTIPPYKDYWNTPGSVVLRGEKMKQAAKRVAREELGLNVRVKRFLGTYENPSRQRHDISHSFLIAPTSGTIKNDFQSSQTRFFKKAPPKIVPYQRKMFNDAKKILSTDDS